jgi:hypothetical protein
MKQFVYPPTVLPDGSLLYVPLGNIRRPPIANGYERDPDNPLRLIPLWLPCASRRTRMWERQCGSAGVTMICNGDCPLKGFIVKEEQCFDCEVRDV